MAVITDVTIGSTATSVLLGTERSSHPIWLKNESSEVITLTIASSDTVGLDPGETIQVMPGQVVTGTAVSGAALLQVYRGAVPVDESATKGGGSVGAAGSISASGHTGLWSAGQNDFTAVRASDTTLTLGTFPTAMGTVRDEQIVLVVVTDSTGIQAMYTPTATLITISGQTLTLGAPAFDATDLGYDVFIWGPPKSFDGTINGTQTQRLNPEWAHLLTQQESASSQGDGTTDYYVDMEGYNDLTLQITDTPGATGLNTYTIEASTENDGTGDSGATYRDVSSSIYGAVNWTTHAFLRPSTTFRAKFVHIKIVRSGDGAATDGEWIIDIMGGNS